MTDPITTARTLAKECRADDERMTPGKWSTQFDGVEVDGRVYSDTPSDNTLIAETWLSVAWSPDIEESKRNAHAIASTRNRLPLLASTLDALAEECERLAKERDAAYADAESAEQRMLCVIEGTFSVGDGTAQREIERLRAEVDQLRNWAAHFAPMLVEQLGAVTADRDRLAAELQAAREEKRFEWAHTVAMRTAEQIAAWLERELGDDSPAAIKAIAADIRSRKWDAALAAKEPHE